jgi:hypothetical protein
VAVDVEQVGRIIATVAPVAAALLANARGPGVQRARVRHDAELLEKLPADSSAREALLEHIEHQVRAITETERNGSRDPAMLAFALFVTPPLGYLAIWLFQRGTWWGILGGGLSATLAALFVYGIFETAAKVPRDAKGKRI